MAASRQDWSPEMLLARCEEAVARQDTVSIDDTALARFADGVPDHALDLPPWDDRGMELPAPLVAAWLLAYNAINYRYWPAPGEPRWFHDAGGRDDEALGVMAAFARALREGVPLGDAQVLEAMDVRALDALLAPAEGAGPLPRAAWRAAGLHELGAAYRRVGGPGELIASGGGDAVCLVASLVRELPSWDDRRGDLAFHKRAQLCVAMLIGRLGGRGPGALRGAERLTAFADYRLPQLLRGVGALVLDADLADRIARGDELPPGSADEVALRAATVVAAERLRAVLSRRRPDVTALVVDQVLWRAAVARQGELPPFHRTDCTDY